MNRRQILSAAPALAFLPSAAFAAPVASDRTRMIEVIEQLEAYQPWETSGTVAAKAFAAWQMRKALGLDMPNPKTAQMHIDYQNQTLNQYRKSYQFERDVEAGVARELPSYEQALA